MLTRVQSSREVTGLLLLKSLLTCNKKNKLVLFLAEQS